MRIVHPGCKPLDEYGLCSPGPLFTGLCGRGIWELRYIGLLRSSTQPRRATWSIRDEAWAALSEVQTLVCRKEIHDRAYLSNGVTSGIGERLYRMPGRVYSGVVGRGYPAS